jgi:hypothetical protein
MENLNDRRYLDFLREKLVMQLKKCEAAPGVQINTGGTSREIPRDAIADIDPYEGKNPDVRVKDGETDKRQAKGEYFSSEKDVDKGEDDDVPTSSSSKRAKLWTGEKDETMSSSSSAPSSSS